LSASTVTRLVSDHVLASGSVIAFVLGIVFQFFPNYWQLIVLAGLVPGFLFRSWLRAFGAGFLGVLLSWVVYVGFMWLVFPAPQIISTLGAIVGIPGPVLVGLAMVVGSLFGGLGAVIGVALQSIVRRRQ